MVTGPLEPNGQRAHAGVGLDEADGDDGVATPRASRRPVGAALRAAVDGRRFAWGVGAAVLLGAAIRITHVLTDDRVTIAGDGLGYRLEAERLAAGLGFTSGFGDVGAETAEHPPGWAAVLAVADRLGVDTVRGHQLLTAAVGLGVIAVAALVARRWFGPRVGVLAALVAAVYPGFWVLESQVMAEPLALLVLGVVLLLAWDLRARLTFPSAVAAGAACGVAALVRTDQLALLAVVVAPLVLLARALTPKERLARLGAAVLAAAVVLAPWVVHNELRFDGHVPLSTDVTSTLLDGNCPPATYSGSRIGYTDSRCGIALAVRAGGSEGVDRSELDAMARREALSNIGGNVGALPVTVTARLGRTLGLFRPAQTVDFVAASFGSATWRVWAWVGSFWVLLALAVVGLVRARRGKALLLPILGPAIVAAGFVAVAVGEPKYRTPADLGIVVLAALGVDQLLRGRRVTSRVEPGSRVPLLVARRPDRLSAAIARAVPKGASILDVGCGDGTITAAVRDRRPDVTVVGVDVVARPSARIDVTEFDGTTLPFDDDAFDAVVFVDVLRDADDPARLLEEAGRVARQVVVVKDHVADGFLARPTLLVLDQATRTRHGIPRRREYLSHDEWWELFAALDLRIRTWDVSLRLYPRPLSYLFDRGLQVIVALRPPDRPVASAPAATDGADERTDDALV